MNSGLFWLKWDLKFERSPLFQLLQAAKRTFWKHPEVSRVHVDGGWSDPPSIWANYALMVMAFRSEPAKCGWNCFIFVWGTCCDFPAFNVPKTSMAMENQHFSIGGTQINDGFSTVMLVFWRGIKDSVEHVESEARSHGGLVLKCSLCSPGFCLLIC